MFQHTVVKKYLKTLNPENIESAWTKYPAHFLTPDIQENIRNSKEEQYQGEFLIDLFVKVLGYIKNPTPGIDLTTELKNVQDIKKADDAIIINDVVKAVIDTVNDANKNHIRIKKDNKNLFPEEKPVMPISRNLNIKFNNHKFEATYNIGLKDGKSRSGILKIDANTYKNIIRIQEGTSLKNSKVDDTHYLLERI